MKKLKVVIKNTTVEVVFTYDNSSIPELTTAILLDCDRKVISTATVKRYYKDTPCIKAAQKYAVEKLVKEYGYGEENRNKFTNALINWQA